MANLRICEIRQTCMPLVTIITMGIIGYYGSWISEGTKLDIIIIIIILLLLCTYFIFSPVNANFNLLGITINLLPLYTLSYFVFCSYTYFCVFVCTRANFVIGLCAVKFARK
jgi:hypothetical protein